MIMIAIIYTIFFIAGLIAVLVIPRRKKIVAAPEDKYHKSWKPIFVYGIGAIFVGIAGYSVIQLVMRLSPQSNMINSVEVLFFVLIGIGLISENYKICQLLGESNLLDDGRYAPDTNEALVVASERYSPSNSAANLAPLEIKVLESKDSTIHTITCSNCHRTITTRSSNGPLGIQCPFCGSKVDFK